MTDSEHTPSPTHCISCGTEVSGAAKFCHACGSAVYRPEDTSKPPEPAPVASPVLETGTEPIGEVAPEPPEPVSTVSEPAGIKSLFYVGVVLVVAVLGGAVGREVYQSYADRNVERAKEEFTTQTFGDMVDRAVSNSPDANLSDALTEEGRRMMERMATDPESSVTTKEVQTASAFLGYYFRHTRGTARYCEGLSVNVDEFVAEFTEQHSAEIEKATASLARHGMNPETLWQVVRSRVPDLVAQEFEDNIEKLGMSSPRELCAAYNANAEPLVTGMHFSLAVPPTHKLLMSDPG